jgi:hypothetical protein
MYIHILLKTFDFSLLTPKWDFVDKSLQGVIGVFLVTYLNIWYRYVTTKTPITPCGQPDPERPIGRPIGRPVAGRPQGVSL